MIVLSEKDAERLVNLLDVLATSREGYWTNNLRRDYNWAIRELNKQKMTKKAEVNVYDWFSEIA